MSNHVGLMLSFIFLAYFIILSGEIIAYQQTAAKAMSITNDVALYIETYGYDDPQEIDNLAGVEYFDKFNVTSETDVNYGYTIYYVTSTKKYTAFSTIFNYMNQEIVCNLAVCRKE